MEILNSRGGNLQIQLDQKVWKVKTETKKKQQ